MQLTKEQILCADDIVTKTINVPQWGGDVTVKTWNAEEKADFEIAYRDDDGESNVRRLREMVVSRSVIDENGDVMFSSEDIAALSKKSGKAMDIVFDAASQLNGVLDSDVEAMVKNSAKTEG